MTPEINADIFHRMRTVLADGVGEVGAQTTRNDPAVYTSDAHLALEQEKLFKRMPLVFGFRCDIAAPGDYLTDDHANVPLLLVRDSNGDARAWLNDPQRSGIAAAGGRTHGHIDAADVAKAVAGLTPLAVAERHGLLMVWIDPQAEDTDVDAHLGPLGERLALYGFDGYHHFETRVQERPVNWKLVPDTFLEVYHLSTLHPETANPIFHNNLFLSEQLGQHVLNVAIRRSFDSLVDADPRDVDVLMHTAIAHAIVPNTLLVMQRDHAEVWRTFPARGDVGRSIITLTFYVPEPVLTERSKRYWDRNMTMTIETVNDEDFPLAEDMQARYEAGLLPYVQYGRNEIALARYHQSMRAALDLAPLPTLG